MMEIQKRTSKEQRARELSRGRKHLLLPWEKGLGPCQVGIETSNPCPYPAIVQIWGVPFCERCAQEQEVYFLVGDLTQPQVLNEGLLAKALEMTRWGQRREEALGTGEARSAIHGRRAGCGELDNAARAEAIGERR